MVVPVELRTERLLLRPFTLDDVEDVLEYTQDPEWARFQNNIPPVPYSREDAEKIVMMFSNSSSVWEKMGILRIFAIMFGDKVIGEIGVNQREEDRKNERVELVYSLSRRYWGKGLMTEAAQAVVNWAFQSYSFNRMFAYCDPRNIGSRRVLEKIGMKQEGILRSHLVWDGEVRDAVYYGILRGEWKR